MSRTKQQRMAARVSKPVTDSYQNLAARIGVTKGTGNLSEAGSYTFDPITRKRAELEYMYRGSWIVGAAVDCIADDMVKAGIDLASTMEPGDIEEIEASFQGLSLWTQLGDCARWARLYGGSIGVMMIDGADLSQPLRHETIARDSFKGILALDRWMLNPSYNDLVTDFGPDFGKPKFYVVSTQVPVLQGKKIHHSRILRFEGVQLPYFQKITEQGWGMSVIERLWDRLLAFDSTTQGAAQLVFKAHLRTMKVKGLRNILAAGGPAEAALAKQIDCIRLFQSTEGMTVISDDDDMITSSYTFSGLSDMILQFAQQISGALQIPLVRLLGQSPAGLNSTGESDLRTYYDGIHARQEKDLRPGLMRLLDVVSRSALGKPLPKGFNFKFTPLWGLSENEKADIAVKTMTAVSQGFNDGIIDQVTALKELRESSDVTGVFSNISDEAIKEAELAPPEPLETDAPEPKIEVAAADAPSLLRAAAA